MERGSGDIGQCLAREERLVGGEQHIIETEQACQGVVFDDVVGYVFVEIASLFLVYVQSGTADMAAFQPLYQCLGINQSAATCIDNHHTLFHLADGFGVNHIVVLGCKRAMERNDVRFTEKSVRIYVFQSVFPGESIIRVGVVPENAHTETL